MSKEEVPGEPEEHPKEEETFRLCPACQKKAIKVPMMRPAEVGCQNCGLRLVIRKKDDNVPKEVEPEPEGWELWPNWVNIAGQCCWILALCFAALSSLEFALPLAALGTTFLITPGLVLARKREHLPHVVVSFVLLLLLLPLVFFPWALLYPFVFMFVGLLGQVLVHYKGSIHERFFEISIILIFIFLAIISYTWAMEFMDVDVIEDVYLDPETPLAEENFNITVVLRDWEGNWTVELDYHIDDGNTSRMNLSLTHNTTYSLTMDGLTDGTKFHYRVRVLKKGKEEQVTSWRTVVVVPDT